ncbi:Glu-tRNA(Gln) amidotransferase subunit GatD [Candidatus Pacearchaeota archaeon]|nr:Glu-tRNA(Gln) amidotransferase subunit GatD [Candidatus Pacearchaeota archaeon]
MVELNFQPGDYVKLRLALEEMEGRILESPDSSVFLIKLNSGYNVGIPKENILAGRVLKKFKEEPVKNYYLEKKDLPSIGLVITGGTIAAKLNPKTGGVHWLTNIEEFAKFYPEIFQIVNVKRIEVPFMTASESMTSDHWIKIAQTVNNLLLDSEIKGVVITHGTDFLSYTSAALSFFLKDLNKPVILTYSQRSIDRASSDANLNLQCAARMALSDAAEVMLVGHASINDDFCFSLRGTKVRKLHSSRRDAFKPINSIPLAKVWPDKIEFISNYTKRDDKKKPILDTGFTDKVALVKFYPGQSPDILDFYALKYKGIVIEAAGLGHLPVSEAEHSWLPNLKKHIKNGFVVCAVAQTIYGRLDPLVYSNGRELVNAGVIFLEDMLAETALVKLGFVLGHYGWKSKVKEKMLENFSGEFSERLTLNEI